MTTLQLHHPLIESLLKTQCNNSIQKATDFMIGLLEKEFTLRDIAAGVREANEPSAGNLRDFIAEYKNEHAI